jgi:hypothetical protein
MKLIEELKELIDKMITTTLCADMELLESEDPECILFGYANGWATDFWESEYEDLFEEIDGTTTKTMVKVIKFCHVYCKDGKADADTEETKVRFATSPEMALHSAMVECYNRELGIQLGFNI